MILEQSLLLLQERFGPDLLERAQQFLVRPREFERDPLRVGGSVPERGDRCVDGPAELRRDPVPRSLRHDLLPPIKLVSYSVTSQLDDREREKGLTAWLPPASITAW